MKKTLISTMIAAVAGTVAMNLYAANAPAPAPAVKAAEKTLEQKHGAMWPKSKDGFVTKDQCLACHGPYEKLAEKTAKLEPNPHQSHLGAVNCEDCHKPAQAKPDLMCNECHNFTIREKAPAAPKK